MMSHLQINLDIESASRQLHRETTAHYSLQEKKRSRCFALLRQLERGITRA
jgi:hypothetical protein